MLLSIAPRGSAPLFEHAVQCHGSADASSWASCQSARHLWCSPQPSSHICHSQCLHQLFARTPSLRTQLSIARRQRSSVTQTHHESWRPTRKRKLLGQSISRLEVQWCEGASIAAVAKKSAWDFHRIRFTGTDSYQSC